MNFDISFSYSDPSLNGRQGHFRADRAHNSIVVDTDREAIAEFLDRYHKTPTTMRAYSKEMHRFQIWAVLKLKKPISSMDRADFKAYIDFIKKPDAEWCGKKAPQSSKDWRPFVGPLAESGQRVAIACINSLMDWLVKAGYLTGNPMGLIRDEVDKDDKYAKVTRYLDDDMWASVRVAIESLPREEVLSTYRYERYKFMLAVFIMLGSRINELSNIKMGHFRITPAGWFWFVNGKGDKFANVAMPPDMVEALMRWREFLGLDPIPKPQEMYSALPFSDRLGRPSLHSDSITPRRIHQILKEIFKIASDQLREGGQSDKAAILLQASAHWLRHTSITQKLKAGIARELVQQDARHTDIKTTNQYIHDEEEKRAKESEKHRLS